MQPRQHDLPHLSSLGLTRNLTIWTLGISKELILRTKCENQSWRQWVSTPIMYSWRASCYCREHSNSPWLARSRQNGTWQHTELPPGRTPVELRWGIPHEVHCNWLHLYLIPQWFFQRPGCTILGHDCERSSSIHAKERLEVSITRKGSKPSFSDKQKRQRPKSSIKKPK